MTVHYMLLHEATKEDPVWSMYSVNASSTPGGASSLLMFSWIELLVFGSMLGLSALIGIYYGFIKSNQNTVSEYMLGGKKMGVFPITISLIASHVSGITLLGVPSEIYVYGSQYFIIVLANIIVSILIINFFVPVFFGLQLNSVYQYLEMRFNHKVRMLGSFIFAFSLIVYIPVVIYVPCLAFNQVTGIGIHKLAPLVCAICIFYTMLGGFKAVVWTDTLQAMFTLASVTVIIILGLISVGGMSNVIKANSEGGRLELFNMDPDPFARNTFWTVTVGSTISWLSYIAVHAGTVQRFISLPSEKAAKKAVIGFAIGIIVIKTMTCIVGFIIYAKYHGCDPIATRVIQKSGQLFPLFVMDVAGSYPGITGLFISGVVSTALSTMSAGLNTVAGTIYEDFVYIFTGNKHTDARASFIMKVIVLIMGIVCVLFVFVVERLGEILQMAVSLGGITHGALLSLFLLGMFVPWANTKGAVAGAVSSMAVMLWLVIGAQTAIAQKRLQFPGKETTIDHCPANFTTIPSAVVTAHLQHYKGVGTPVATDDTVPLFFQLSYMYYNTLGTLVGVIVGVIVSYFTGFQDPAELNPNLFIPQLHKYLPEKQSPTVTNAEEKMNHITHENIIVSDTKL